MKHKLPKLCVAACLTLSGCREQAAPTPQPSQECVYSEPEPCPSLSPFDGLCLITPAQAQPEGAQIMDPSQRIIIAGKSLAPPAGLDLINFKDDSVYAFKGRKRDLPVTEIIVHESVSPTVEGTIRALRRRGLGVHLIIAPDGRVTQHADLALERLAHAGPHNKHSIGLEIINPYYGARIKKGAAWCRTIDGQWPHRDCYLVPTAEQAEAAAKLIAWLTSDQAEGLEIPRNWIGQQGDRFYMHRVEGAQNPAPGIYAHHYFGHADGAWPVFYSWLRFELGLPPCAAYEEACRRASNIRRYIEIPGLAATSRRCAEH